jgi:hypothetical protein
MKAKLKLIREQKLYKLLPGQKKKSPLEASGVAFVEGYAYVIFDSLNSIGKIDPSFKPSSSNQLIPAHGIGSGFEDITFDPRERRFYTYLLHSR